MLILTIVGVVLGFLGSLILAISLGPLLKSITFAITMHDAGLESLADRKGPVPTGSSEHVIRAMKSGVILTVVGLVLLCAGFLCQMAVVVMPLFTK